MAMPTMKLPSYVVTRAGWVVFLTVPIEPDCKQLGAAGRHGLHEAARIYQLPIYFRLRVGEREPQASH